MNVTDKRLGRTKAILLNEWLDSKEFFRWVVSLDFSQPPLLVVT